MIDSKDVLRSSKYLKTLGVFGSLKNAQIDLIRRDLSPWWVCKKYISWFEVSLQKAHGRAIREWEKAAGN